MKTITAYQTNDNKIFTDLNKAKDHEYFIELIEPNDFHLTEREQETVNFLIKTDLQINSIAEKMNVSTRTIKAFCSSIYKKMEVKDRVGLLIKTYTQG
jgi:DNA-binding NarL/FixJ family response regulator